MSFVRQLHGGLAYGDGVMTTAGTTGQLVKISGNNTFAENTGVSAVDTPSFGILGANAAIGDLALIQTSGVLETDVFTTGIAAGNALSVASDGKLQAATGDDLVVGRAISVSGGVLTFRLSLA